MKITLIITGKTREEYLHEGIQEYVNRIRRYASFNLVTIKEQKSKKSTDLLQVKSNEGKLMLRKLDGSDYLVLLDERGKTFTSVGFAKHLTKLDTQSGHIVFAIGGAYGFSDEVYKRANEKISLSNMTFSHQMVRLFFVEQLYRAFTILNREPYHHQ